mgnify:CR=1 FL=1
MPSINNAMRKVALDTRTNRQIICDTFGISYAASYRSPFANVGTPARKHKPRHVVAERAVYSPAHSHVGKLIRRLFR